MKKPAKQQPQIIIEARFNGDDERLETIKLFSISALNTRKWDGYSLLSIDIYAKLRTLEDCETIRLFLSYHGRCLWPPLGGEQNGK